MTSQMSSTARKIHNLLSSGAVTVTGPTQPRILKPKVGNAVTTMNNVHPQNVSSATRCYVCDEALSTQQVQHLLLEMQTAHTVTKFPNKIGQLVGDAFLVIVSGDDVICARCTNLINYLDRLENDVDRVRTNILGLLNKKYGMYEEGGGGGGGGIVVATGANAGTPAVPPVKMQKLNSGVGNRTADEIQNDTTRIRKINSTTAINDTATITKQTPPVSAVQQMKITTQPTAAGGGVQQTSAGTQTLIRKITKIYKCLSCDYKTSDMRLFNTHYETCKQQNFQCKNCKKIYPNFGQMKQHMIREHNTPMENTCAVCHINLVNDASLRKHMEANHATSVVVTSTTTIPASSLAAANAETTVDQLNAANAAITAAAATAPPPMNTSLYACNQCQFKSTDKVVFDEHLRKHLGKPKPFKCRLCSQRYETREAATAHLKYHPQSQANFYKCGTCGVTFSKRELLAKHIETQHPQQDVNVTNTTTNAQLQQQQQQMTVHTPSVKQQQHHQLQQQQQHHQQQPQQQNMLTTQKLLQDTINEALSENIGTSGVAASAVASAAALAAQQNMSTTSDVSDDGNAANNIRFYSCQICSLTFLNENYYNQHMGTHRRDSKKDNNNSTGGNAAGAPLNNTNAGGTMRTKNTKLGATGTALLNDGGDMATGVSTKDNDISAALAQTTTSSAITTNNVGNNNNSTIPDVDIESIFEKMHSDNKGDSNNGGGNADLSGVGGVASNAAIATNNSTSVGSGGVGGGLTTGENVVISSQEGTVGGITFNISIPQASSDQGEKTASTNNARPPVGIDMPMLDPDDDVNKHKASEGSKSGGDSLTPSTAAGPVSMPSLDDDNDGGVLHEQQQQQQQQQNTGDGGDGGSGADLLNEIKLENNGVDHIKLEKQSEAGSDGLPSEQQQQEHHQQQQQQQQQEQQQLHNNIDDGNAAGGSGGGGGEEQHHGTDAAHNDANENATPEQLAAAASSGGATAVQTADGQVAIELDEAMQAQVDSGQIKFILNENGQLLQLGNHIITDADGNQILVQDPEQIQQLLQSVGVLQTGDGIDSETLQVMTDANGQMVLVQGENNETQLIDASLLNADGQLVIQQGQDGELGEGAHVIGEDGTRIPVSVSYTADGQPIVQVQHQVLEAAGEGVDGQQLVLEGKDGGGAGGEDDGGAGNMTTDEDGVPQPGDASNVATTSVTTTSATATTSGGGFFSLAEIMQQQQQQQQQEQQQQQDHQHQQQSSETKAAE